MPIENIEAKVPSESDGFEEKIKQVEHIISDAGEEGRIVIPSELREAYRVFLKRRIEKGE